MDEFIENQLAVWPEARARYLDLGKTERRRLQLGDFTLFLQYNPARIHSTAAKTDVRSIAARPCFLCAANRPEEQIAVPVLDRWQLLLNPFPIFPVHFTIASTLHEPQSKPPIDMAALADLYPGLAIFFNGSKAGASAPDHLHLQGVLKSELPLVKLVEKHHNHNDSGIKISDDFGLELPFAFFSAIITPDEEGSQNLLTVLKITGTNAEGDTDGDLRNVIFWKDDMGMLRAIVIPRKNHRPSIYGEGEGKFLISPGTIDMAGVMITPRLKDFEKITENDVRKIFAEVANGR